MAAEEASLEHERMSYFLAFESVTGPQAPIANAECEEEAAEL